MKNTYSYLFYFFIAVFLIGIAGCNKKTNTGKPEENKSSLIDEEIESDIPVTIQLSGSKKYEHTYKFTDLVERVEYIPLETTDGCLLGDGTSVIKFTEEFIFIKYSGGLYQFDRQGKFIKRINRRGQGPGECDARNIGIDEKSRLIYIFDNWTLSIVVFDFEGKHIRTIRNPFKDEPGRGHNPSYMGCDNDGNIFYTFDNPVGQMKYKYVVSSNDGEILYRSPNFDKYDLNDNYLKGKILGIIAHPYPIYEYKNYSYYSYVHNDTIFRINEDYSCSPVWIIHIPNRITIEEELKYGADIIESSALNGKNSFKGIREGEQHLYIYHNNKQGEGEYNYFFSLYNKKTRQLTENINLLISNDWDGGMSVELDYQKQSENIVYELLWPFKMKEQLTDAYFSVVKAEYPEAKEKLQTMVKSLQEGDNPVIMILTLK